MLLLGIMDRPVGLIHLLFSIFALVLGSYVLLAKKGTKLHKKIGYGYVFSMLGVNLTAFMIYRLFGSFGMFHWLALVSLSTLMAGMIPLTIRRSSKSIAFHISFMYWSVIGLYCAFFAETLTRVPKTPFFTMVGVASFVVCAVAGIFFSFKKKTWFKQFIP